MRKDLTLAFVGAAVVTGGVLGGRALFSKGEAPTATMVISVNPPGTEAKLKIDGIDRGIIGADEVKTIKEIAAGVHRVEVIASEGRYEAKITLAANDVTPVTASIESPAAANGVAVKPNEESPKQPAKIVRPETPIPAMAMEIPRAKAASNATGLSLGSGRDIGFLVANSTPSWARVWIDHKDTGKSTPIAIKSKIPLPAGKHVVTFVHNGRRYDYNIVVKAGEETRVIGELKD